MQIFQFLVSFCNPSENILQVIANFSASWCGPCRMIAPLYCELSEKYPSMMFLTIDVDELTVSNTTTWEIKWWFCRCEHCLEFT